MYPLPVGNLIDPGLALKVVLVVSGPVVTEKLTVSESADGTAEPLRRCLRPYAALPFYIVGACRRISKALAQVRKWQSALNSAALSLVCYATRTPRCLPARAIAAVKYARCVQTPRCSFGCINQTVGLSETRCNLRCAAARPRAQRID